MKKVLLLNPPVPGKFHRDYYCSHSIKGDFLWQPLDLQIISGFLKNNFKLKIIDSVYYNYSFLKVIEKINNFSPDVIISQIGSACINNDMKFLAEVKNKFKVRIAVTGDICRAERKKFLLKYPFIDAVIYNVCKNDIEDWIIDWTNKKLINIITLESENIEEIENDFSLPMPDFNYFIKKKYKLPVAKHTEIYTIISNFGCPFKCKFCHFENIPCATRNIDNLENELKILASLGVKELHFRDQTFGYDRNHVNQLIKVLAKYDFNYIFYTRADCMNYQILKKLKKTGADTIEIGVESGVYEIRKKYGKDIEDKKYVDFFKNCKKLKIKTLAFFIIGFPDENISDIIKTWKFIKKLSPDFLSINIFVPKQGTSFERNECDEIELDPTMGYGSVKLRIIRTFMAFSYYFSPFYIAYRLRKIESLKEFTDHVKNAVFFVKSHINFKK